MVIKTPLVVVEQKLIVAGHYNTILYLRAVKTTSKNTAFLCRVEAKCKPLSGKSKFLHAQPYSKLCFRSPGNEVLCTTTIPPDPKLTKPEWFWRVCLSSYVSSVRPTDYKSHQEPFSGDYSMAAKEIELFKSQANIGFTA